MGGDAIHVGLLGHFHMKQEIILSSSSMIRLMETLLALLPYMTWTTLIYSDKDVHVLKRLVVISCVFFNQCIVTMWSFMLLFSRPSEPMVCPGVPSAKKPYARSRVFGSPRTMWLGHRLRADAHNSQAAWSSR